VTINGPKLTTRSQANHQATLSLIEAKLFCKNLAGELESFMNEMIKVILDPISGFLGVPPKKNMLPVRLKRSCSTK
jgi:hypothetical protein